MSDNSKISSELRVTPSDSPEVADLKINLVAAREAYRYAIKVIENYAMDIRSDPRLLAEGFCQGEIYRDAKADILRIASRT